MITAKRTKVQRTDIVVAPSRPTIQFSLVKKIGLKERLNNIEPIGLFIDCILGIYRNDGS